MVSLFNPPNDMWIILFSLLAGTVAGYFLRRKTMVNKTADAVGTYIIYLLLFIMGLRVGTNPDIMSQAGTLGLQALLIALFALAGSVILSWIVYPLFFRHED